MGPCVTWYIGGLMTMREIKKEARGTVSRPAFGPESLRNL